MFGQDREDLCAPLIRDIRECDYTPLNIGYLFLK